MHIIMYGNPSDGFRFQGPFEFYDEAREFAAKIPGTTHILPLQRPEGYVFGAHKLDSGEDPWIDHKGHWIPKGMAITTIVEVRCLNGREIQGQAGSFNWTNNGLQHSVQQYRIID